MNPKPRRRRCRLPAVATSAWRCCVCDAIVPLDTASRSSISSSPQEAGPLARTARLTAAAFSPCDPKSGCHAPKASPRSSAAPPIRAALGRSSISAPAKAAVLRARPRGVCSTAKARPDQSGWRCCATSRGWCCARLATGSQGKAAVDAQCLDAQMPARHPRSATPLALRQAAPASRAATACRPSRPPHAGEPRLGAGPRSRWR